MSLSGSNPMPTKSPAGVVSQIGIKGLLLLGTMQRCRGLNERAHSVIVPVASRLRVLVVDTPQRRHCKTSVSSSGSRWRMVTLLHTQACAQAQPDLPMRSAV
jgi:hypothetical protein